MNNKIKYYAIPIIVITIFIGTIFSYKNLNNWFLKQSSLVLAKFNLFNKTQVHQEDANLKEIDKSKALQDTSEDAAISEENSEKPKTEISKNTDLTNTDNNEKVLNNLNKEMHAGIKHKYDEKIINTLDYETQEIKRIRYLLNFQILIVNFLQDKDYSNELKNIIISIEVPKNIFNIIQDIAKYNEDYLSTDNSYEVIFPKENNLLESVIKIKKKTPNLLKKEAMKLEISNKLNDLIHFIYSSQFQQILLEKL